MKKLIKNLAELQKFGDSLNFPPYIKYYTFEEDITSSDTIISIWKEKPQYHYGTWVGDIKSYCGSQALDIVIPWDLDIDLDPEEFIFEVS